MIGDARDPATEWRAGGTDLQDRRRRGVAEGLIADVDVTAARTTLQRTSDGGVRIGALVRVETIATDPAVRLGYRGLAAAAAGLATPQIRAVATLGGALLQRQRCWYYRQTFFDCFKKGGTTCPARDGDHRYGVVLDLGPCVWPHPSTLGVGLLAYDGLVLTDRGRTLTARTLVGDGTDPTRDHHLEPGELLDAIVLPPPVAGERASYLRAIARQRAEWPLVEVVVRLRLDGPVIVEAIVSAGAVANVPIRIEMAESALRGRPLQDARAALSAVDVPGRQLDTTMFKLPLLRTLIADVVDQAVAEPIWTNTGGALSWSLRS